MLEAASQNGRDLYNILVAPARQEIAETSRILIIPDGALNDLNFETLLVAGPKLHYLIEDTTIVNASSLRLVTLSSQARSGRESSCYSETRFHRLITTLNYLMPR